MLQCEAAGAAQGNPPPRVGKLEVIDSLKFDISGIESGVRLPGERIATELKPTVAVPAFRRGERPAFTSTAVWLPPSKPRFAVQVHRWQRLRFEAGGGGFGAFSGRFEAGLLRKGGLLRGEGWLHRPPRRTDAGLADEMGLEMSGTFSVRGRLHLTPFVRITGSDFTLAAPVSEKTTRRDLAYGGGLIGLVTPVGEVDAWGKVHLRRYKEGFKTFHTGYGGLRFTLFKTLSDWRFKAGIRLAAESYYHESSHPTPCGTGTDAPAKYLDLKTFTLGVERRIDERVDIDFGGVGYIGSNGDARFKDLRPRLGLDYIVPLGGVLSVMWSPGSRLISRGTVDDRYPMLISSARGGVAEDVAYLKVNYIRAVAPWMDAEAGFTFRDARRVPLLTPLRSDDEIEGWTLSKRRIRTRCFKVRTNVIPARTARLEFYAIFQTGETVGAPSSSEIPDLTPWTVGLEGSLDLHGLAVESRIVWRDRTPLDLGGAISRPAFADWGLKLRHPIGRGWSVALELDILLDQRGWTVPGYDLPPTTATLSLAYLSTSNRSKTGVKRAESILGGYR